MNRRKFLRTIIVATAAAPLSICAPLAPAAELPRPNGWDGLLPWQKEVLDLVAAGGNVRIGGACGVGKSWLARYAFKHLLVRHIEDFGSHVHLRHPRGVPDYTFDVTSYGVFSITGPLGGLPKPSLRYGQQRTHLDRS